MNMMYKKSKDKSKKAMALILSILVLIVLGTLSVVILTRSVSENNFTRRFTASTKAFWVAEAGVNRALKELAGDFNWAGINDEPLGGGTYSVSIASPDSNTRKATVTSSVSLAGSSISRQIEVLVKKQIPADFYDQPIYSAGKIDFNGSSYGVTAEDSSSSNPAIVYGGDFDVEHSENITGTTTSDPSVSPLARFDFQELHDTSQNQGNVYDADRLKSDSLPSSFWYTRADDGVDNDGDGSTDEADEWVPNVVYVESDLQLNGSINIGGFFVVVGDVITDPDETDGTVVNGNGTIEGVIYTLGEFRINGGGGNLNVNGGVWAGNKVRLNGDATVTYNRDYMDAIQALNINPGVYISSWKDSNKPYKL